MTHGAGQVLKTLQAAGEAGATNGDLAGAGGWSWRNRVRELRRLGYDIHEQGGLWFLEGGVEGARGGAIPVSNSVTSAPAVTRESSCGGSSGTLSTDVGRDIDTAASSPADIPPGEAVGRAAGPRVDVSPSTERLFEVPAPGHYSEAA